MLFILTCACGGAGERGMAILKEAKVPNYLETPHINGKANSLEWLDTMDKRYKDKPEIQSLVTSIKHRGSFVVILGVKNGEVRWADINRGGIKEHMDAVIIAEQFA